MPKCPNCRYHFRVPDGDRPEEHGCPRCGYGDRTDETEDDDRPEDSDDRDEDIE